MHKYVYDQVIQVLLHVCVFPEKKIRYTLARVPNSVKEMAPKQTIRRG